MEPIIQEVKEIKELDAKPEVKKRIIEKLQESSDYSQRCYEKTVELEQRLDDLEKRLQEKDAKIAELEAELSTWRSIKVGFWTLLSFAAFGALIITALKFRKFFGVPI